MPLPSFSLCTDDDSHSSTPCRNLLSCTREGERERKRREGCVLLRASNTQYLFMCPDLPALFTQIPVLISIPFGSLQGGNAAGVFALLEPWVYYAFIRANKSLICNRGALGVYLDSSDAFNSLREEKHLRSLFQRGECLIKARANIASIKT